jgi:hypothetical protein
MNLRNWSKQHTFGLLIGIASPLIFIPLVILILAWLENFYFSQLWYKFTIDPMVKSKIISISIISNLIWFYFFLNREKWGLAMGVILGTIIFLPYVIYVNFIM